MQTPNALTFHYQKSPFYRAVYADGVHGGFAPTGEVINIAFWSTRKPLPDSVTHTFVPSDEGATSGNLGPEVSRQATDGMVREIETLVTMPSSATVDFLVWLATHLKGRGVPVEEVIRDALKEQENAQ